VAIDDISIDIEEGCFFAIVGPSGCGKTTMLRILGGLETGSSGNVEIADPAPGRPRYSMIFQGDSIFPWMTVWDNAAYGLRMRKAPRAEVTKAVTQWLDRTGLTRFAHLYPHQLSGGMRQRVSLIRTLVHDPSLLLMDEPFGALDALTRLQVRTDLEALWLRRRPTVLFITHSVEEAVGLSDRILVMSPSPGGIVEEIQVDLARPRPIVLGDVPEFAAYVDRIHRHFERLGVLHGLGGVAQGAH